MKKLLLLTFSFLSFFTSADAVCSVTINATGPTTFCAGDSVILGASFTGTGPFLFSWSNGATTSFIIVKTSGTYTVTITDVSSCNATSAPVVVNVNPLPVVTSPDKSICFGQFGTTLTASGAGNCNCIWSPGALFGCNITVSPTATTTYTVTCTDINGCTNIAKPTITVNPLPTITTSSNQSVCRGMCAILTASGALTYVWSPVACLASTTGSAIISCCSTTTTFTVTGTNANGCTNTATTTVTVNPSPILSISKDTSICFGNAITITASGGKSYSWSTGNTSTAVTTSIVVNPTSCSTYTVTASDINGCFASKAATVCVNPLPLVNASPDQTICLGRSTIITSSGVIPCNCIWSPPVWLSSVTGCNVVVTPVTTGTVTYTVTCTDTNGCKNTDTTKVTGMPPPSPPTITCTNDTIHFTPTAGYTYQWLCNNSNIIGATDTFYVPKTSCNYGLLSFNTSLGCSVTSIAPSCYTNACSATINPSGPTTFCQGGSVALTALATGTPPYLYSWSNGETTSFINVTTSGTYTVSISDFASCTSTSIPVAVTVKSLPVLSISKDTTVCSGSLVTITVSGGSSYSWSNAQTTSAYTFVINTANTLCNTYTVWGSNANGCSVSKIAKICVNPLPLVNASSNHSLICQGDSAILTSSGVTNCNCKWSPANNITPISGIGCSITAYPPASYTYSVTCIDTNGCMATIPVTVNVTTPNITVSSYAAVCNGNPVTLTAGGASTYSWSTGQTGSSIILVTNPTVTTIYTVTGITSIGCTSINSVRVGVPIAFSPPATICVGSSAFLFADGGPGATYSWVGPSTFPSTLTDPLTNNPTASPTTTTTYSVSITDVNGCTTVIPVTVIVDICNSVIEENNDLSDIRLYPNPFSNSSILIVPDEIRNDNTGLFIYDVLGNRLNTIPIEKEQTIINREDLASGIYFYLIVKDDKRIYVGKMVVE